MARIEYQTLVREGACSEQRQYFADKFNPGFVVAEYSKEERRDVNFGTEVTRELCEQFADIFDFDWAAEELLDDYGPAYTHYRSITRTAYTAWEKASQDSDDKYTNDTTEQRETRNAAYSAARHLFGDPYWTALTAADDEYNESTREATAARTTENKAAWTAYKVACGGAFFEAYEMLHNPVPVKDAVDVG